MLSRSSLRYRSLFALVVLFIGSIIAACGGGSASEGDSDGPPKSDPNAQITVWIDATREAPLNLYKEKHPEDADKINVVLAERGEFPSKVLLFNNAGSGWPDVIFAEPEIISKVATESHDYPADLTPYVSQEILSQFADGANDPCTFDGKLLCLRNDLAQNLLWYNKPLMDEFGYEVPTTWEEFEALGERLVAEHPGYVMGPFGDEQAMYAFYWGGNCPVSELVDKDTVRINLQDPRCVRVTEMVDRMLANGSLSKLGPFDPAYAQLANENKVLMMTAASWFGEYVFGGKPDSTYYREGNGQLVAAMPLKWADDDRIYTGAHGGSAWTMSRHTKNADLAAKLILWLTTSNDYQGTAPTMPAYLPAANEWSKTLASNPLYGEDPYPVLRDSSSLVSPIWGNVRYDKNAAFKAVVISAILQGNTVASALPEYQRQLTELAKAQGYKVVNE